MVADESSRPVMSAALMPRSLLVFSGEAYEHCLHGIDEVCFCLEGKPRCYIIFRRVAA